MKWNSFLYLLLMLISSKFMFSADWTASPSGTANSLWGMYFLNDNVGWVVGVGGTIRKTNDGGTTWIAQTSVIIGFLNQIRFVDANNGWIVGDPGVILNTTDGGTNWVQQTSGSTTKFLSLSFVNSNYGWVVGETGEILKTTDGGTNWATLTSGITQKLWGVDAVSTSNVFACGEVGIILKTTDGGINWNTQNSTTSNVVWDFSFVSETKGWAVCDSGIILQTLDGGANWIRQTSPTTEGLYDVHFVNDNYGWAVGATGTILRTTDGGANWTFQTYSGFTANSLLVRVYVTQNLVGYISTENGGFLIYSLSSAVLTTSSISSITNTSAISGGNISSDGGASVTARGIVWSTIANPTIALSTKTTDGTGTGAFTSNITGLSAGTTYYVRAYAINSEGTAYGSQTSFTTTGSQNNTPTIPNNGDGNGDGIVDSLQSSVVTILNQVSNSYITIISQNGNALNNVEILSASTDNNYTYPYGFAKFSINSSSASIKIIYHNVSSLTNYIYRKQNINGNIFTMPNAVFGSEIIGGQQVATVTFSLTDGGIGDFDGIVNGVITDPGGPAVAVSNIPTLSEWARISLVLIMICFGVWYLRNRQLLF